MLSIFCTKLYLTDMKSDKTKHWKTKKTWKSSKIRFDWKGHLVAIFHKYFMRILDGSHNPKSQKWLPFKIESFVEVRIFSLAS